MAQREGILSSERDQRKFFLLLKRTRRDQGAKGGGGGVGLSEESGKGILKKGRDATRLEKGASDKWSYNSMGYIEGGRYGRKRGGKEVSSAKGPGFSHRNKTEKGHEFWQEENVEDLRKRTMKKNREESGLVVGLNLK